jgi:carbon-monoxide dehydrogenase large subunit
MYVEQRRRREDERLITGQGQYVDDLRLPEGRPALLHMVVVRSPYAHADITEIRLEAARALPGVVAAVSAADLMPDLPAVGSLTMPALKNPGRRALAVGRARYVGDPVAVVLAEDRSVAVDARDLVEVDYAPLLAMADPEAALAADAPLLYEEFGSNVALRFQNKWGDSEAAFARADRVVRLRLVNQRLAPSSLEPRACLFDFDQASGLLTAWLSSQAIYRAREVLAGALGLERGNIRVYNADVGGGFGAKSNFLGEEYVAAALAVRLGRPVKWIESRSENLQAQTHGRGQINYIEAACMNDGRVLGLRVRTVGDAGAFPYSMGPIIPAGATPVLLCGPYQIEAVETEAVVAYTNKPPTSPYRGAGRPEATYILERVMDRVAHELGLDPAEVRRCNFIPADAFPHRTVTGLQYDSGNYQQALDRALELAGYADWRAKQQERRAAGDSKLLGIGLSTFIESTGGDIPGPARESAAVRVRQDGTVLVQSGVATNGQGHFTTFAQITANVFNLPAEQVEVQMNDSALPAFSIGTFGSRVTQTAGSVVHLAAVAARDKALQVAAQALEAAPADLVLEGGRVFVQGVPTRTIGLGELARMVEERPELIEHEPPNPVNGTPIEGLAAWRDFSVGTLYGSGAHLALVEVDTETGEVKFISYVSVDDCGHVLNHVLVEGQVHGSLAQGIGQALYEEASYDETGQPLAGTLLDYSLPTAQQIPSFVTALVETPSPENPLGVKGVGEAGTIAAPPAVVNAALDALAPLGITALDMPLKPERVWALIQAAKQDTLSQPDVRPPTIFS